MGFEVNGLPVLSNTYGLANYTNTFKTLTGQSLLGSGNIQDTGAGSLKYNEVGTYTFAQTLGTLGTQRAPVAGSSFLSHYDSRFGGYAWPVQSSAGSLSNIHYASGTWALKCLISSPNSGGSGSLFIRIS